MENKLIAQADYYFVEPEINSNKFWTIQLFDNDVCITLWGRNGTTGQSKTFPDAGREFFYFKCLEKERKGYQKRESKEWNESKNDYTRTLFGEYAITPKKNEVPEINEIEERFMDGVPKRKKAKKTVNKQRYQLP